MRQGFVAGALDLIGLDCVDCVAAPSSPLTSCPVNSIIAPEEVLIPLNYLLGAPPPRCLLGLGTTFNLLSSLFAPSLVLVPGDLALSFASSERQATLPQNPSL